VTLVTKGPQYVYRYTFLLVLRAHGEESGGYDHGKKYKGKDQVVNHRWGNSLGAASAVSTRMMR
jgi:hypothetical protein